MTDLQLTVLHALRLCGLASGDSIADATGIAPGDASALLSALATAGLVKQRGGRMPGFVLTPAGKAAHAERLPGAIPAGAQGTLEEGYTAFLPLNADFKQLCTDWQLRPDGSANDHSDPAYDGAAVERLGALHAVIVPVTDGVAAALPHFTTYRTRFDAALRRLHAGDHTAFARPLADSYHDIWMQLHQDFLLSLGRERTESDGH